VKKETGKELQETPTFYASDGALLILYLKHSGKQKDYIFHFEHSKKKNPVI